MGDCAFQPKLLRACLLTERTWICLVFLHAPDIHEVFSVQGMMCALLLFSWPAEMIKLWPILLIIPGLAQDEFKTKMLSLQLIEKKWTQALGNCFPIFLLFPRT